MRAVLQRVTAASVSVDGLVVGACGAGLLVLLGVAEGDEAADADRLAGKVARLRLFENDDGKFDRALLDTGGEALVVSQFTLIADYKSQGTTARPGLVPGWKGNRPSFTGAARSEVAEPLFDRFVEALRAEEIPVQTGVFGARMQVELVNDGPVTIILDV